MLSPAETELCDQRPNAVDHARIPQLHYLGNYTRRLPVNMTRMMENAYDWEHLPYIHASSFSSIDLIASGKWGWRAKIGVPSGGHQLLDLLIDLPKNYWVSTVISGPGEGIEIHTQASTVSDTEIDIDVRFYTPEAPADEAIAAYVLKHMQDQYELLYDEDTTLMEDRQIALDERRDRKDAIAHAEERLVGKLSELDSSAVHTIALPNGRFCVRHFQGQWIVHSASCPHMLGPLNKAGLTDDGELRCPWHGYRFDALSGENIDGKCKALATPPDLIERNGNLYLRAR